MGFHFRVREFHYLLFLIFLQIAETEQLLLPSNVKEFHLSATLFFTSDHNAEILYFYYIYDIPTLSSESNPSILIFDGLRSTDVKK